MPSRDDLLEELLRVANELGRAPSQREMQERSPMSKYQYIKEFGSWNAARNAADLEFIQTKFGAAEGEPEGYTPTQPSPSIPEEELLEEIRRLTDKFGRIPKREEMDNDGKFSAGAYSRRFNSWRDAISEAGYEPRPHPNNQGGENNYNWKGGYGNYGSLWGEAREEALKRDEYECQICGCGPEKHRENYGRGLEVHHIQPSRKFDDQREAHKLSNLITLCLPCHRQWEGIPLRPDTS